MFNKIRQLKEDAIDFHVARIKFMFVNLRPGNESCTFKGHRVFVSDDMCLAANIPSRIYGAYSTKLNDGEKIIVINNKVANAGWKTIEAILLHEVGHIELGHLDSFKGYTFLNRIFPPDTEYEADKYAFEQGGDILSVLKTSNYLSVKLRIRRLEKMTQH